MRWMLLPINAILPYTTECWIFLERRWRENGRYRVSEREVGKYLFYCQSTTYQEMICEIAKATERKKSDQHWAKNRETLDSVERDVACSSRYAVTKICFMKGIAISKIWWHSHTTEVSNKKYHPARRVICYWKVNKTKMSIYYCYTVTTYIWYYYCYYYYLWKAQAQRLWNTSLVGPRQKCDSATKSTADSDIVLVIIIAPVSIVFYRNRTRTIPSKQPSS